MPLGRGGHKIGKAELLFSKIEDEQIEAQLEKLKQTKMDNKVEKVTDKSSDVSQNDGQTASAEIASQKPTIQYDDFAKIRYARWNHN